MRLCDGDFAPSLIFEANQASPEAMRAQRMAELKDIAEWRARRLAQYQAWSDPAKRAEIQRKAQEELKLARQLWEEQVEKDMNKLEMHMPKAGETFADKIMVRVLEKAPGKRKPWYRRLLDWLLA